MNTTKNLLKVEDPEGLNYIVQSNLTHYESKTTADKYSIKSVKKGIEHYTINGVNYQLAFRNFIIVSPGQEIEIWIDSPSEVTGICYFLDPRLVNQIRFANTKSIEENLDNTEPMLDFTFGNFPINVHHTFLNNFLHTSISDELDQHQVSELLILLAEQMVHHQDHTNQQLNKLEGIRALTKVELYKRIQIGRQYIHDNYQLPISLKEVARAAALSEYYYHRNFRLFFNKTPYQYHNLIRMEQAQKLLNKGKYNKSEVAYICGFQDPKYFSKAYKKWLRSSA